MIEDLIKKNRSTRRFDESVGIDIETLKGLVDLARLSPSAANDQPLKYILSNDKEKNEAIFGTLRWAGYLKEWDGPAKGERPGAYIMVFLDKNIATNAGCDHGIAAQSILLGAVEKGLAGCIIGSIDKKTFGEVIPDQDGLELQFVIAIGKPKETIVIEEVSDDIKYWRDQEGVHHVPKRSLDEIITGVYENGD